jgi:glutamate synthase (NADPH/NADH) small chain
MGATCSRVCPVEELCEGACVLGGDHKPIAIGRLQRYAMDHLYSKNLQPFEPASRNGKKVAVVGAGPAGLTCAGELAKLGYEVTVYEKKPLPGGLSTYGIVVMREPIRVSLEEVEFIKKLGVTIKTGIDIGNDIQAENLLNEFDAVFIGSGMGKVPDMEIPGEDLQGVTEALSFIAETKLAEKDGLDKLKTLPIGNRVAVIGAGNTAIDAATIAKRLGAEQVTIVYRRSDKEMTAYEFEYEFIKNEGVEFRFLSQPIEIMGEHEKVTGLKCVKMQLGQTGTDGRRQVEAIANSEWILECDQVIKAIGQEKPASIVKAFGLETEKGYIKVSDSLQTSNPKVYAGGDCIRSKGEAMTVTATQDGKIAARSIHAQLSR